LKKDIKVKVGFKKLLNWCITDKKV
jgi:hypothetical protein